MDDMGKGKYTPPPKKKKKKQDKDQYLRLWYLRLLVTWLAGKSHFKIPIFWGGCTSSKGEIFQPAMLVYQRVT